jgi:hypothetical protein
LASDWQQALNGKFKSIRATGPETLTLSASSWRCFSISHRGVSGRIVQATTMMLMGTTAPIPSINRQEESCRGNREQVRTRSEEILAVVLLMNEVVHSSLIKILGRKT